MGTKRYFTLRYWKPVACEKSLWGLSIQVAQTVEWLWRKNSPFPTNRLFCFLLRTCSNICSIFFFQLAAFLTLQKVCDYGIEITNTSYNQFVIAVRNMFKKIKQPSDYTFSIIQGQHYKHKLISSIWNRSAIRNQFCGIPDYLEIINTHMHIQNFVVFLHLKNRHSSFWKLNISVSLQLLS